MLTADSASESYSNFIECINNIIDTRAPITAKKVSNKKIIHEPWMTTGLLKSSQTTQKLYRKCIGKPKTSKQYTDYIDFRNRYNYLKRLTKKTYFSDKITEYKHDSKKLWQTLNLIIGKSNNKGSITDSFKVNGILTNKKKNSSVVLRFLYKCR